MINMDEDSLEEGEIPSPNSSPKISNANLTRRPEVVKKRRRKRRGRNYKCSHCGKEENGRNNVPNTDDFDTLRNKYFLRLRQEKSLQRSRDYLSRLPRKPETDKRKQSNNDVDDAILDKLLDQALKSQKNEQSSANQSQEEEEELDENSLRAEALKTALIKKSRTILNKKQNAKIVKMEQKIEPMQCDNHEKENESIDEEILRQQLLETLEARRKEKAENLPSTSKIPPPAPIISMPIVPKPVTAERLVNNSKKLVNSKCERIVVRLGPDSSDDDDSEPETKPVNKLVESKIDEFLLNARRKVEEKQSTHDAVNAHLPLSQRIEYCRLKKTLAEKELKCKTSLKQAAVPITPTKPTATTQNKKQTIIHAKRLLAYLKKEEANERRSNDELARLRMQIGFIEQKKETHARNAMRVRTRLKSLLSGAKKIAKTVAPNPDVLKQEAPVAAAIPPIKNFSTYNSPLNQTSCVLDPLRELCPHDLAGECRDPGCQYQHTPPQTHLPIQNQ